MRLGVAFLVVVIVAAAVILTFWPGLDLQVSSFFRDPATGAWAADTPALQALRHAFWMTGLIAAALFTVLFALALALRGRAEVPARLWGFAFLAMALGPGVLANLILKEHWGRARPRMVTEFGGEAIFTPALQATDQCLRNCSFVSGEVATTATLSLVIWLLLAPRTRAVPRLVLAGVLALLTGVSALLRIAAGGHFLSDAIFAALLSALLTLALWRLCDGASAVGRLSGRALLNDLAAALVKRRK